MILQRVFKICLIPGSPDDDIFKQLATAYSNGNDQMAGSTGCSPEDGFENGITNGAAWYSIGGGKFERWIYMITT